MIDYEQSAKLNNCNVEKLKARFKRFPGSGKKIIAFCDGCGKRREIKYQDYGDLCLKCACTTLESREENTRRQIKYYEDHPEVREEKSRERIKYYDIHPEAREKMSKIKIEYYNNHPEIRGILSKIRIEYYGNQKHRNEMSEIIKNSDAHKVAAENMHGGNDIVEHHYIYDESDLSKNIILMTRSVHTRLHNLFREIGIEIPHINTEG